MLLSCVFCQIGLNLKQGLPLSTHQSDDQVMIKPLNLLLDLQFSCSGGPDNVGTLDLMQSDCCSEW